MNRILVRVEMPHLAETGLRTVQELCYECDFPVEVGDIVSCPPMPMDPRWRAGTVVALHGGGYTGPAKTVRQLDGADLI